VIATRGNEDLSKQASHLGGVELGVRIVGSDQLGVTFYADLLPSTPGRHRDRRSRQEMAAFR
jgi:hypothetical protein